MKTAIAAAILLTASAGVGYSAPTVVPEVPGNYVVLFCVDDVIYYNYIDGYRKNDDGTYTLLNRKTVHFIINHVCPELANAGGLAI